MNVTDFKAHCLQVIGEVSRTGEPIQLTKRGMVVATVNPPSPTSKIDWTPGAFRDTIIEVGDIESPVFDPADLDLEKQWF